MDSHCIRAGIVDDHQVIRLGLAGAAKLNSAVESPPILITGSKSTVDDLLADRQAVFDLVVLDLSLNDGSTPGDNVRKLRQAGFPVLIFTVGENVELIRQALAAGAAGVSRKSEDLQHTLLMMRRVAAGETIGNQELASAISIDSGFVDAQLSDRERETLLLYATGFTGTQVGIRMNIKANTVNTNIKRIREKYAAAGRYSPTKIELRKRAVEDGIINA